MMHCLPPIVEQLVDLALGEDLGNGDVTTRLTVNESSVSTGKAVAKAPLVVSGGDVFALVMKKVDPRTEVCQLKSDGTEAGPGDVLLEASGPTASLLMAERVALNFLQRLSGVATLTKRFVEQIPHGASAQLTDTRKTSPGMRFLERRAVRHGGGRNHRPDLGGGILIKENHIRAAGSVKEAVTRCLNGAPHPLKVEVEVTTEAELEEALAAGAHAVLLDNMSVDEVRRAVEIVDGKAITEISGGVTEESIEALAQAGVDIISSGALTHSSPAADISFLIS
jgi:nicotinate-nucleotide pyrophosphorylase (carboxylating)